ncbi:DUF5791 family protein [Natrinema hispanicum]|uniref:Uncharacterized protein n=1 Tax=Natrinema hispanicum TaxID=392421 RepID=A0A1G6P7J6_9EURY|nr:DUF5791 family protein [Natrinema hispanicum]SDC75466.1 hypothetical protein SAMN05192552_100716 [Natrinema hispanicum]SEU05428.1 hypothetical protein SAMN04488694_13316 [Natrinema hispanicum]
MFYEQRMTVPDSPAALRAEYEDDLATIVDQHGPAAVAAETDLEQDVLEALAAGDSPDLTLEAAAEIQSLAEGEPGSETIVTMALEHLLLGMSTAVLDVEALESYIDLDLEAKEIQQKIEGRAPMSFEEFVHVQYVIADGAP